MLEDKYAFVTGGSRGIGAAIVRRLAAAGAHVAFSYNQSKEEAEDLARELGARVQALPLNLTDADAVSATVRQLPKLDILVANAGVFEIAPLDATTIDVYDRIFAVNVRSVVAATVEAARRLPNGSGRVILVGSINGESMPYAGGALYAASKGAVRMLSKGWARDLGPRGITVNVVQPGPIDTDMNPASGPSADFQVGLTALGRYGRASDVAELVAFLASSAAANITGASINIDGGTAA